MSMKADRKLVSIMVLFLTGCSSTIEIPSATGKTVVNSTPIREYTPSITLAPSVTPTPTVTETPTNTDTPSITLTPTPPPDLELTDVTIYPNTYTKVGQDYMFMGRMRNNTNTTMVNYVDLPIFKFTFDVWEFDKEKLVNSIGEYHHNIYQTEIKVSPREEYIQYGPKMNCILFPGEEGVITFPLSYMKAAIKSEIVEDYKGPLGISYAYESSYQTWPNLPKIYREKAENLTFQKTDGGIVFDFDLDIPIPLTKGTGLFNPSWIIYYDSGGEIIDILYGELKYITGFDIGKRFHIHGSTFLNPVGKPYYSPAVDMTQEMIDRVDHMEVFTEMHEGLICSFPKP